eukprot:TRINITY_DN1757_c0_g2_i7.p1 TRINITY_DN1757_c0_g2~~TRINITY_DN1757_c0_g2_i7.p1  ORF type:complete len:270 (+),score=41.56 TRINITY_DN1757_c0_g2_i7:64-810(+)
MDPGGMVWGVSEEEVQTGRSVSAEGSNNGGFKSFSYESVSYEETRANFGASSTDYTEAGCVPQSPRIDDDEDLPILTELGIHPEHIKSKALSVLNPFKIQNTDTCKEYIEDEDLAGPFCFALLLGFAMMLEGKMHFGHIYAYGVTGCLLMYGLLNLMSDVGVGLQFTLSILGYNILPLCFLAFIAALGWLLLSSPSFILYTTCAVFITWSSWCATQMFVVGLSMQRQWWLLFYPLMLFYTTFALITIF